MAVAQFLAAIVSFFATSTPLGKIGLSDIGKALLAYLIHSGALALVLTVASKDIATISNPVLAAFLAALVKLAMDLLAKYSTGAVARA